MTACSSRPFSLEEATSPILESEAIFADTGVRIHPWERVFSKNIANVAIKICRLIGEYDNIWLGDINPEHWTRGTLQSLQTLLLHATSHIDDPNQRKERLSQIKTYLVTCAFADAWRGMKPTLYPRHLQNARLFFSISHHQDHTDENTADESHNSEADPVIPTPQRPVTRKRRATESLHEAFPKQPCRPEIAVSARTGDNIELLSTDCDLSSGLKQQQDGAKDNFSELLHKISIRASTAVNNLELERAVISNHMKSLEDDLANAKVSLTKLKHATFDELDEHRVFIEHMALLCDAGPKGLKKVVDALGEQGLEFKTFIYEHVSDEQVSVEK